MSASSFLSAEPSHLSAGGSCVPDSAGHVGEDGDEPALTIELVSKTSANAAQQSSQQVVVTSAELTVLQVVLQKPDAETQNWSHVGVQPAQAEKNQLTRRGSEQFECPSWLSGAGNEPKNCPSNIRTSEPETDRNRLGLRGRDSREPPLTKPHQNQTIHKDLCISLQMFHMKAL